MEPPAAREYLRTIIGVALALVPRRVKQDFADRYSERNEAARKQLSEAAADAVAHHFHLSPKESREEPGTSLHSRLMQGRREI